MTTPTRQAAALVALGAVLLAASYPPFRFPALSFLAVAPAVVLLRRFERENDPRDALRWGFWYGFVVQGAVLYWLVVALWHFTPLSALGYLATIAIFGLWHALLFWLVVKVRLRLPTVPLWVVFPVAWTAVEWAVGHQGDIRFPWLGLGTSLADASVLVQWADVAGARGVTLWLAWTNVVIVDAMLGSREQGVGRSGGDPQQRCSRVSSAPGRTVCGASGRFRSASSAPSDSSSRTRASGKNGTLATPTAWWRSS